MFSVFLFSFWIIGACFVPSLRAQNADSVSQCQQIISSCINETDSVYLEHVLDNSPADVCLAINKTLSCYKNAFTQSNCNGYLNTLSALNYSAYENWQSMCPSGPSPCLFGLKKCKDVYEPIHSVATNSNATKCKAAQDAAICYLGLPCGGELARIQANYFKNMTNGALYHCTQDSRGGECEARASSCLTSKANNLEHYEAAYNFDSICELNPSVQECFNNLSADTSCSFARYNITVQKAFFTNRFNLYCNGNQTKSCIKNLEYCFTNFSDTSNLDLFKSANPIIYCQGMKNLVTCLQDVSRTISDCPAIASVQAIASLNQQQTDFNSTCSNLLNDDTQNAAQCVTTRMLEMQGAQFENKWDKFCRFASDAKKCLDPALNTATHQAGQDMLRTVSNYIANVTNQTCRPGDTEHAIPCLQQVQECSTTYLNTIERKGALTNSTLCGDRIKFRQCLNGVVCQKPDLINLIMQARNAAITECLTTSGGTSVKWSLVPILLSLNVFLTSRAV